MIDRIAANGFLNLSARATTQLRAGSRRARVACVASQVAEREFTGRRRLLCWRSDANRLTEGDTTARVITTGHTEDTRFHKSRFDGGSSVDVIAATKPDAAYSTSVRIRLQTETGFQLERRGASLAGSLFDVCGFPIDDCLGSFQFAGVLCEADPVGDFGEVGDATTAEDPFTLGAATDGINQAQQFVGVALGECFGGRDLGGNEELRVVST